MHSLIEVDTFLRLHGDVFICMQSVDGENCGHRWDMLCVCYEKV